MLPPQSLLLCGLHDCVREFLQDRLAVGIKGFEHESATV